jgi:hypothetical protein
VLNPNVCLIIALVLAAIAVFAGTWPFQPTQYPWRGGFFFGSWFFYLLFVYSSHSH